MGPWPIEGAGGRTYWIIQQEIKWLEDGTRKPLYVIARQDEKIGWGDFDDARAAVERENEEDKSMTAEEKQAWPEIPEVKPITVGYEHIEKLTDLLLDNYDDRLNKLEARAGAIAERLEKLETLTTYSNDGRFSDLSQRITTWTERIKELETCVREICIPSKGVSVFDLVESLQRVDIRLGEHIRAGLVRVEKLEENRDDMCKRLFALEQADVMQDDLANRMTFRESPMSEPETQEETTANEEKLAELHRLDEINANLMQEKRQQAEFDRLQDELLPHERRP